MSVNDIVIKGQFLVLSSPCCPYVHKNSLPIAIRFSGCGHGSGSVYGSGFMETMMENKIESDNVCITDADPHTDVRTLWKRSFILVLMDATAGIMLNFFYIVLGPLKKCVPPQI